MISINNEQCKSVANILFDYEIKPDFFNRGFINVKTNKERKIRAYFYAVAICHQTYKLANEKENLYGWDYLEDVFYKLLKDESEFFDSGFLIDRNTIEIENIIRPLFSSDGNPANCTLDRLEERISFMKEIDIRLHEKYNGNILNLIDETEQFLSNSANGFYKLLPQFISFSDPYKKKISFLVKLLEDAELVKINDPENYIPIMDYHMQRVLMRLGCIEIENKKLYDDLVLRIELDSDSIIRNACIEAIKIIAKKSSHSIASMNDYFWPHGRSCCNETPICESGMCEKQPCSLSFAIDIEPNHKVCIFDGICKGKSNKRYRKLWQPVVKTHFY